MVLVSWYGIIMREEKEEKKCYIMSFSNEIFFYVLIYMDVKLVVRFC